MRRSGLTLVEMVVVVFLLLILIGLLLSSIRVHRLPDERLQTNNNLRQCALGVHGYHDNYRRIPGASTPWPNEPEKLASLWFHILPYVEQDGVYKQRSIDAIVPQYQAFNDPSSSDPKGVVSFAANIRVVGRKTLLDNLQPVDEPGRSLEVPAGVLHSGLNFGTIPDGTSNVILLTTRYSNCAAQKTWYAADALGNCSLGQLPSPGVGGFMGAGSHSSPAAENGDITMMFQLAPKPNRCLPQSAVFGHSFSTGGMSVAMGDGSVRNVRPDLSPLTFSQALCPADKAALGPDWNDD